MEMKQPMKKESHIFNAISLGASSDKPSESLHTGYIRVVL